jgi:FkbM family methyltransferase
MPRFLITSIKLLGNAIHLLIYNPGVLFLKIAARWRVLFFTPSTTQIKNINGVQFEFDITYDPSIKWMYASGYEIETVLVMKKFLKDGDTFIDVGANIGYVSAIAAGLVGKSGQIHCFEPVPAYFQKLQRFAEMNNDYNITLNNSALGDKKTITYIDISDYHNIGWNTMVPGLMKKRMLGETIEIPVGRLDDYLFERKLRHVTMIKIDTEGYEFPVLLGLTAFLGISKPLPVILCEILPEAYPLLGYTLIQIKEFMAQFGYKAFDVIRPQSEIEITTLTLNTNVVFRKISL